MKEKNKHSIFFAKLSVPFNAMMAVGKISVGIFFYSFFLCFNAFYNIGIAAAKFFALRAFENTGETPGSQTLDPGMKHDAAYRTIGGIVLVSSLVFVIYSIRLFIGAGSTVRYPQNVAIAIAAVTFTEIIVSMRGVVTTRRNKEPLMQAIKLTNLSSAVISLVLTQTALLSFTYEGDASIYNGLSGILFGGIAALIGVYMIIKRPYGGRTTVAGTEDMAGEGEDVLGVREPWSPRSFPKRNKGK